MVNFAEAGNVVRKLIDSARRGELDYEERAAPKIDWTVYDLAQVRELVDMIEIIRRLVDVADERVQKMKAESKGPGRPPTPAADISKILLLQSYLGVPNRVAEGLILLFGEKLGLRKEFSYKTIERGYDRQPVNEILDEVFKLTNEPVKGLERVFSTDGTGFPTSMKQNYAQDREHQRSRTRKKGAWPKSKHGYVYNVAVIGTKYKLLAAWRSTCDHSLGELAHFPQVAMQTKENHPDMEMMLGDGLYAGRPQCKLIAELGARPRFLPRRNATLKRQGVKAWMDMLLDMAENPQEWFANYHLRSISETGNSGLKNRKGPIRKRLDPRKETESYLRAIEYNLRRLGYLVYLVDLLPLPSGTAAG
jgi:transposase